MINSLSWLFIALFSGGMLTILLTLECRGKPGSRDYKKPLFEAKTPEPEDYGSLLVKEETRRR